ncbi:hypothetical protein COCC4DRAFT_85225 [Bipolaris maydis ATCC 48331]|uniref:Uncharacterized protein n=2 Tax=Cochliobolus heterostrophus TaxID=5016 RepID=M2TTR7_COCH5|nr:uncharacterized protein COCC4DRAFT_85225 [Bipolaris maydis ATCC 48331]EMD85171.1 hypothetical protein COCHEDRAFT_1229132 [Bipolaris maydis C5]KAJ5026940.1 Spherulation-specific family 4 [Bipolaris maydis]ENH99370.1 hypothetical protein COCC4DRAFT_85225 [Bipolaris maydis ATCC 48331]KAJ5059316.1 Spherulation-specific family 4 [Bipolaris maydis]KAJ6197710.1 Spherulation-specific family 4 [Bipolaris maydis]
MMSILLPLYIYPSPGAWDPLYAAAKAHRDVSFTVVLNPCSGPCMGSLPDSVYLDEIPKLAQYPNIRTLGYVATHYTQKTIDDVLAEIDTYSNWPYVTNVTRMRVDGIFFDETPSTFTPESYAYLERATYAVKNASTTFKKGFIAHNPGLVPLADLDAPGYLANSFFNLTDLTVVFEETFEKYLDKDTMGPLSKAAVPNSKLGVILHSVPRLNQDVLSYVIGKVEEAADWVFLTSGIDGNGYHDFSEVWQGMVAVVGKGKGVGTGWRN